MYPIDPCQLRLPSVTLKGGRETADSVLSGTHSVRADNQLFHCICRCFLVTSTC